MASIFDIIGPVMIGPSSSHTAGADRMGRLAKQILGEDVLEAKIYLHGSFGLTWKGHGTDKAILAGLLGYDTDDENIRISYELAKKAGLKYEFIPTTLPDAFHPNSILLEVKGKTNKASILCSSIGGGVIILDKVNQIEVHYKGEYPTLVILNKDTPGVAANITNIISKYGINIETMSVTPNREKGDKKEHAVTVIGLSKEIDNTVLDEIKKIESIKYVILLSKLY